MTHKLFAMFVAGVAVVATACTGGALNPIASDDDGTKIPAPAVDLKLAAADDGAAPGTPAATRTLVLAGGCFWCVEAVFEPLLGVKDVVSGYAGGSATDANYSDVANGKTQHAEVVEITYDPSVISYGTLLHVFFATHTPTTGNGQHPDYGTQYRPAVFYANDEEAGVAGAYITQLNDANAFDAPIATGLETLDRFYPAEEEHQDFVKRNPQHPYVLRWALPKIEKVKKLFPELLQGASSATTQLPAESLDPVTKTEEEWRSALTPEQFRVLREEGTERAGSSPLNNEKRAGVFRCAGCNLSLFASDAKFESGTGWPSFYQPVAASHIAEVADHSHGMTRTEVECPRCGGHLGHVFNDGPKPTGLRYCINGAALTFDPR
ncbi:MAG: peptide-methionine (R)-S-oxide reductase MsrB [Phycisphaerales bacterium]